MHLRFISMHMENFMSFEHADVSFTDVGYTLVSGVNENPEDNAHSNGSGKSSLWEALSWCLTGTTIRGCKNVSNMFLSDGALVELDFYADEKHYHIIRSKDHHQYKTNLQIFVDEADRSGKGLRESEVVLKQLLPDLTSDLIGSVIILGQGLPCRLSARTPAGRKELLEKFTRSDFMIEDIKTRLSNRRAELNAALTEANTQIANISGQQQSLQRTLEQLQTRLAQYNLQDWQEQKQSLSIERDHLTQQLHAVDGQVEQYSKDMEDEVFVQNRLSDEKARVERSIVDQYETRLDDLQKQAVELGASVRSMEKLAQELARQPKVCPTCGRPLAGNVCTNFSQEAFVQAQTRLAECTQNIQQLKADRDREIQAATDSVNRQLQSSAKKHSETALQLRTAQSAASDLRARVSSLDVKIAVLVTRIENYYQELETIDSQQTAVKQELVDLQSKVLYYNKEAADSNARLDLVSKMITLSTRDFRGYLLTNTVSYLEKVMQSYCTQIFRHSDISLKLEGNALEIKCCGKMYESLSGGERQKIDLITQLAIRQMLCSLTNFDTNILVLDEVFDSMDSFSCQRVIDFISTSLCNVEAIYVITHHTDLQIPCDHEIIVCKNSNNISRIV